MSRLITFSSDYGATDSYVGVCHLVIAKIAPDARVVDLVHGIDGIRSGSVQLAQAVPFSPADSVHLSIVDPGVGTARRAVVIVAADGSYLVGPDNGLLVPGAEKLGGIVAAYELTEPRYQLEPVSNTFHGREIFAPAAAYLADGVLPDSFGPRVHDLVRLGAMSVAVGDGALTSDVAHVDHYGNLQLAASEGDLAASRLTGAVSVNGVPALMGRTFADVEPGALVVYVDSGGHVAVACNEDSATALLEGPTSVDIRRRDEEVDDQGPIDDRGRRGLAGSKLRLRHHL